MKRATALLALIAISAALITGCDDEDSDPRSDFVKQGDRICLKSGIRPKAVPNDMRAAAAQLGEEASLRLAVHRKLAALEPPENVREDYARFLGQTLAVARNLERMARLARAGRETELSELGRRTGLVESERLELAKRMGYLRCGRPITDPVRGS